MKLSEQDLELLDAAIDAAESSENTTAVDAFENMVKKDFPLSPKQRAWAQAVVAGERYVPEEEYQNLVSSGKVPRGREVATLPVLMNLPKRPPGRR